MRDDRRRGGWITTVLALGALVVVGFLCGALAGFLWEEPGLVIAYLSGETEAVEWTEPGAVGLAPPAAEEAARLPMAPPPTPAVPQAPAAEVASKPIAAAPEPRPTPKPPPAAPASKPAPAAKPEPAPVAAVSDGRFAVQVGAFGESDSAEKLADRLRARGYPTYVRVSTDAGESRWRVRVGPVSARSDAEDLAAKLRTGEKLPTWILDEGDG